MTECGTTSHVLPVNHDGLKLDLTFNLVYWQHEPINNGFATLSLTGD